MSTAPKPGVAKHGEPKLEVRDLVVHFPTPGGGEPIRAVDGVSLTVHAGELVALYGPSGSGKTTLLLTIAAVQKPTSGSVIVGGRDITKLSDRQASEYRLRHLGFISANSNPFPAATALENAALKLRPRMRAAEAFAIVEPILELLGIKGEALKRPSHQMSKGENQRVGIARGIADDPDLVIADEPTGALDQRRTHEIFQLLRDLCHDGNRAILMVTHDPVAAKFADAAHSLRDGKLGAYEPPPPLQPPVVGKLQRPLSVPPAGKQRSQPSPGISGP